MARCAVGDRPTKPLRGVAAGLTVAYIEDQRLMDKIPRPVGPARPGSRPPLFAWQTDGVRRRRAGRAAAACADGPESQSAFAQHPQDMIRIDPVRHNRTMLLEGFTRIGQDHTACQHDRCAAAPIRTSVDARYPAPDHPEGEDPLWNTLLDKTVGAAVIVPVALVDLAPLPTRSSFALLLVSSLELWLRASKTVWRVDFGVQRSGLAPFYHDAEKTARLPSALE